jgi:hypothetical protein
MAYNTCHMSKIELQFGSRIKEVLNSEPYVKDLVCDFLFALMTNGPLTGENLANHRDNLGLNWKRIVERSVMETASESVVYPCLKILEMAERAVLPAPLGLGLSPYFVIDALFYELEGGYFPELSPEYDSEFEETEEEAPKQVLQ